MVTSADETVMMKDSKQTIKITFFQRRVNHCKLLHAQESA